MATGFEPRFGNNSKSLFNRVGEGIKNLSRLGMRYEDMILTQSMAVGPTEALFSTSSNMPAEMLMSLALSDVGMRKYVAFFDKEYKTRRNYLRTFSLSGEIEWILDTLSDDAIVMDSQNFFCYPNTDKLAASLSDERRDEIVEAVRNNFKRIYTYFFGDDVSPWHYFKQFLIDGFLAFEIIFDKDGKNIVGFKELDPVSLRLQVEQTDRGLRKIWYQYEEQPHLARRLYDTSIIYISYAKGNFVGRLSYVERLVRSFNLLRIMEHTRVIWNLMNSTYRLKMTVPIGTKSPQKAKESLAELMGIYKEDIMLDFESGELLIDGKPSMQFYKNYMFPVKEGESVDISTIGGDGPDLSDTNALLYFHDKLKVDSKIPFQRWDRGGGGGSAEAVSASLDHEEIRYSRFINRLRSMFQEIIIKPLWVKMCLDFPELQDDDLFRANLGIDFNKDNDYEKNKRMEVLSRQMSFVNDLKNYTMDDGTTPFFSSEWLIQKYLDLDPDELKENEKYKKKQADEMKEKEDEAEASVDGFGW